MILRSVELESFGRFRGQVVEFRRGMNLVIGPNEAGKSTLAEAVPAVLFGTDRLEKFKTWGRNACSAALVFEGRGRTVEVKRNLITDDVELLERDDLYHVLSQFSGKVPLRGRSALCRDYRDRLEALLGVADEKLFRASYFFGHHPQEWNGEELAQKLRALISGTAETDYAEILDNLLDEHFQLTRSNPWGRDKQRDREYEEVCQRLAESDDGEPGPVAAELPSGLEDQLEKLAAELDNDRREYEKGLRYIERFRQDSAAVRQDESVPGIEKQADVKPAGAGTLKERLVAAGLPADPPRELPQLLADATEIRHELAALQQPFALLGNREKRIPKLPWSTLLPTAVLFIATAVVAWWRSFHVLPLLTGCAVGVASLAGWAGWRYMQRKKARAECRRERNRLEQLKAAAQKRQAELSERCEALGLPSSAIDLVRLQKAVASQRELLESYWNHGDAPQTPSNPSGDGEVAATPEAAAAPAEADEELRELEERMAEFSAGLQNKELRLQELKIQFASHSRKRGPGMDSALHDRKRELEERIAVLRKAIDLLAGAVDRFSRSHLVRLHDDAGRLLGKITAGRYPAIRLDEDMRPSLQVDSRRWVPVDALSRGTVDAIYLVLRIALANVRDDGRSLPMMLDDPFVHLDHKRLSAVLNAVDLAAADGQLILFSHNLELGKRAARERWHVVSLDGEPANMSSAEGGENAGQLHLL